MYRYRYLLLAVPAWLVLAFLVVPILALLPMSLSSSTVYELIPTSPSLVQYRQFFTSPPWLNALANSTKVALGTTVLATVLGTAVVIGLRHFPVRSRNFIQGLFVLPQTVPTIVYAVAVYFVFVQLGISGSLFGIVIAHTCLALPFVVLIVGAAAYNIDPRLEEASRSLGSGPIRTFWRVTFRQILPAVLGGALFSFQLSFDETIVALFISGTTAKTLPVKIWDSIFFEVSPILPAISVIITLLPILLSLPFLWFLRRRNRVLQAR